MKRRTVLQSLAAIVAARPLADLTLVAQTPSPTPLTGRDIAALHAMAEVVLPTALGADGRDSAVAGFVRWVRNYKEGAERGGGYGNAQLGQPTGPSPATGYPAQFAALDRAAEAQGGASFATLPLDKRRAVIEAALNEPQRVNSLPQRPNGANLVADFMGHYFQSADARDLCYQAQIGRDTCRGLEGSDRRPPPLGGR